MKCLFLTVVGLFIFSHPLFAQQSNYDQKLLYFYENQQYAEAIKLIEDEYPAQKPQKVLAQLGSLYNSMTNYLMAEQYLLKALAADSTDKGVLLNLARINARKWTYPQALNYYERYIKLDSLNVSVYKSAASLVGDQDSLGRKMKYWNKAYTLNPTDPEAAKGYSSILSENSQKDSALSVLKFAYVADTTNLNLVGALLSLHYQLEHYDQVINYGKRLLEENLLEANYLNMIARAYLAKENFKESLEVIELINEKERTDFTYSLKAMSLMRLNRNQEALAAIDKAIIASISESVIGHYRYKGIILNSMLKSDKALEAYQRALQFEHLSETDSYAAVFYNLGLLQDYYLSEGNSALKSYQSFLNQVTDTIKYSNQIEFVKKRMSELKKD
ncbi:tetratricopeptide repeat protein [Pedobacter flavus]|uniref:Tetratricopeptide repeat protein n=1 Tax=Pedobacter flavus TaxID=3113906 RepID=A0ABU7GY18_9SPHI|nr:hypothetical protein [Pedobacter sp. VNH31]MEE1883870.1 hypothetical protein [Pedobacter sp. VNH31]